MKKILFFLLGTLLFSSCTLQSTFYLRSNQTGSFVLSFKMSKELMEKGKGKSTKDYSALPRQWTSMYEVLKAEKKDSLERLPEDSVKNLKKMFIRFNFENENQFSGAEMKMDSIGPGQWQSSYGTALSYITKTGGSSPLGANNKQTKFPFTWDGSVLNILVGDDLTEELTKTTALAGKDGKESAEMLKKMKTLFGGGDIEIVYRFVLDKKIGKVQGKNDLVKKIDDHTIEVRVRMFELIEKENQGKKMKHKDSVIQVYTK